MTQAVQYTLEQFGENVRRTLAAWGSSKSGVLCLGPILQRLAREGGPLHEMGEPATLSSGLAGRRLYKDPADGFLLLWAQYAPDTPTAVHSHEGWVAICLLTGSERYTSWRRADDASDPNRMRLEVAQEHHMLPGDVGYLFNEPFNIHRQWPGADGAAELVLMAGRGRRLHHIDEATGECSAPPEMGR